MRLTAMAIACAFALAACSGGGGKPHAHPQRGADPDQEGGRHVRGVTGADQLAYYQLATTTGTLRLVTSGAAIGRPQRFRRRDARALRLAAQRLGRLAPRDPKLKRALVLLRPSVTRIARARVGKSIHKVEARRALAAAERSTRLLRAFTRRHPGLGSLLPD